MDDTLTKSVTESVDVTVVDCLHQSPNDFNDLVQCVLTFGWSAISVHSIDGVGNSLSRYTRPAFPLLATIDATVVSSQVTLIS